MHALPADAASRLTWVVAMAIAWLVGASPAGAQITRRDAVSPFATTQNFWLSPMKGIDRAWDQGPGVIARNTRVSSHGDRPDWNIAFSDNFRVGTTLVATVGVGGEQPIPPPPPDCTTPKPGPDWVCVNGGWLPPGMVPTPSPPDPGCTGVDPFDGIPGLIGDCINGGWIPVDLGTPLTLTHLEPNYRSAYHLPDRIVVRSQTHWQEVWAAIWQEVWSTIGTQAPPPPLPAIDFDREMLIVAAMGDQPLPLYGISIQSAFENAGGVTVRVRSSSGCLPAGSFISQVVVSPMDIVRLPRRDAPLTFMETTSFASCSPPAPAPACAPVLRDYLYDTHLYGGYIVMLKPGTDVAAAVADLASRYGLTLFAFQFTPAFYGLIPESALQALRCEPVVESIQAKSIQANGTVRPAGSR